MCGGLYALTWDVVKRIDEAAHHRQQGGTVPLYGSLDAFGPEDQMIRLALTSRRLGCDAYSYLSPGYPLPPGYDLSSLLFVHPVKDEHAYRSLAAILNRSQSHAEHSIINTTRHPYYQYRRGLVSHANWCGEQLDGTAVCKADCAACGCVVGAPPSPGGVAKHRKAMLRRTATPDAGAAFELGSCTGDPYGFIWVAPKEVNCSRTDGFRV